MNQPYRYLDPHLEPELELELDREMVSVHRANLGGRGGGEGDPGQGAGRGGGGSEERDWQCFNMMEDTRHQAHCSGGWAVTGGAADMSAEMILCVVRVVRAGWLLDAARQIPGAGFLPSSVTWAVGRVTWCVTPDTRSRLLPAHTTRKCASSDQMLCISRKSPQHAIKMSFTNLYEAEAGVA